MPSDIKVTVLTAAPAVGGVTLSALTSAPPGMGCLPYMVATKIEFWASATNDRATAAKIGESDAGILVHTGLSAGTTRYYWARAIDPGGNTGDFFPASATAGISATTLTTAPGPNSVGTTELQNNAVTPSKLSVGQLSAISADLGTVNAGTINGITINGSSINGGDITGGSIHTSVGSSYVGMESATNEFAVWSSGIKIARIGIGTSGGFNGIISVNDGNGNNGVFVYSAGGGAASAGYFQREGSGTAVYAVSTGSGSGSNAMRGENQVGGGLGYLGIGPSDGSYGVYAGRGGVGPFTGAHDALIAKDDPAQPGDIVVDIRVIARNGWGDTLTVVAGAQSKGERGVVGVIDSRFAFDPTSDFAGLPAPRHGDKATPIRRHLAESHDRLKINGVGEGQLSVCGRGGDLRKGDLICASSLRGKGERQNASDGAADDLVRGWTVAKAREDATFASPDEIRRVACIYLCG